MQTYYCFIAEHLLGHFALLTPSYAVCYLQYSPTTTSHYHALSRLSMHATRKELPSAMA